jgi:hypothetical protein
VQERIVDLFALRAQARTENPEAAADKTINGLVALLATRGLGKSTELVQLPASAAYKEYARTRLLSDPRTRRWVHHPHSAVSPTLSPVVSVLSFNSEMENGTNSIGLRIIFGTIRAMGLAYICWAQFVAKFKNVTISATEAVQMIHEGYGGEPRRVLLCVDELSKAGPDDEVIMDQLGSVLGRDGNCDVVVTSLSLEYLQNLTTASQRPVLYVPLHPLASDAHPLAAEAATAVLNACGGADLSGVPYKVGFLKSAHILASGHPRTLAKLEKQLKDGTTTVALADELKKLANVCSSFDFLWGLCQQVVSIPSCLVAPGDPANVRLILSTVEHLETSVQLRSAMNRSYVQLCGPAASGSYRVTTTLAVLLRLAVAALTPGGLSPCAPPSTPLSSEQKAIHAFGALLGSVKETAVPSVPLLWERCRMLSTVMRMLDGGSERSSLFQISGGVIKNRARFASYEGLKFVAAGKPVEYEYGYLVVPPPQISGYDYTVFGQDEWERRTVVYEEIKVRKSSKSGETYAKIVANKVRLTLAQHFVEQRTGPVIDGDFKCHFRRIAFLFSRYEDEVPPTLAEVTLEINAALARELDANVMQDWVQAALYVEEAWEENVGFLKRAKIPATLPVAELVRSVEWA